jgi:hypothetical protein
VGSLKGEENLINVRDYGARGNGIADDTIAIQKAIDYTNSKKGGTVFIPEGIYMATHIRLYSNITLTGTGEKTILKLKNNCLKEDRLNEGGIDYNGIPLLYNTYSSSEKKKNIVIKNLKLDGNYQNQKKEGANYSWGMFLYGIRDSLIENVFVTNFLNHGIIVKEAENTVISKCKANDNGQDRVRGFPSAIGGNGIVVYFRSNNVSLKDSIANNNTVIGIESEGRSGPVIGKNKNIKIINCRAEANWRANYLILLSDNVTLEAPVSIKAESGIKIVGSANVYINNPLIEDAGMVYPLYQKFPDIQAAIAVRPEIFGKNGTSNNINVKGATIKNPLKKTIYLQDVHNSSFEASIIGSGADSPVFIEDSPVSTDIDISKVKAESRFKKGSK